MKGAIVMGLCLTAALLATACGGGTAPTPAPSPTIGPPPAPPGAVELADARQTPRPAPSPAAEAATPTAAAATGSAGDPEEIEKIRRLAFEYWTAFNEYDKDTVLSYLEESYRAEREDKIGKDIGRIKLFRVTLGVSQLTPPGMTGPDEAEMMLSMKEPLGTRQIRMAFRKVDGEWKITHAEEAK